MNWRHEAPESLLCLKGGTSLHRTSGDGEAEQSSRVNAEHGCQRVAAGEFGLSETRERCCVICVQFNEKHRELLELRSVGVTGSKTPINGRPGHNRLHGLAQRVIVNLPEPDWRHIRRKRDLGVMHVSA